MAYVCQVPHLESKKEVVLYEMKFDIYDYVLNIGETRDLKMTVYIPVS